LGGGIKVFCEKELRDIEEWECNKWECKYGIGNGGYCLGCKGVMKDV